MRKRLPICDILVHNVVFKLKTSEPFNDLSLSRDLSWELLYNFTKTSRHIVFTSELTGDIAMGSIIYLEVLLHFG